jgi:hypothetical protein
MPKRSRQAHIPQQVKRRKVRRPDASQDEPPPQFADPPLISEPAYMGTGPVAPTPPPPAGRRRLELVQRRQESVVRVVPGQLPTFERAFLMAELRQIGIISGALLALIVVLALIVR